MNIVQVAQLIVKDSGVAGLFQGSHNLQTQLLFNILYSIYCIIHPFSVPYQRTHINHSLNLL